MPRPFPALFNALAVVALFFVVGKLIQQRTGKIAACSAMLQTFSLAAAFYRAGVAPKRFSDMYASAAVHLLFVTALTAQNTAP
jgi:uncharacterized membrane protein YhaH (DUF805 family)